MKGVWIKKLKIICAIICTAALLSVAVWKINERANENVVLVEYTFTDGKIPSAFNGYKIFVISDLHNAPFSEQIIEKIYATNPDIIVFLGDMAQLPDYHVDEAMMIAREFYNKIPTYAIEGNHESQNDEYWYIYDELYWEGVQWIRDGVAVIEKEDESILLLGIKDPVDGTADNACKEIEKLTDEKTFSVLLSHRADLYPYIKDSGADLIISGHLHGGIIRLPIIGGIVKKDGTVGNAEYEYGYIKEGSSAMIVSGGCDKNPEKKRWFNPPEVLVITLESE